MDNEKVITKISFEIPYSDDSGIEFGIRLDKRYDSDGFLSVIFKEGSSEASFPAEKIPWLIECLQRILMER